MLEIAVLKLSLAALAVNARQVDSRRARAHHKRFHRRSSNYTLTDMYSGDTFFELVRIFFIYSIAYTLH